VTVGNARLIVVLVVIIDLLGFGIVLPSLPLYAKSLAASPLMIGVLQASFSAMQMLFAPWWGRLSDRIGRRPVLLIGLAGSVLFYALFGWAAWTRDLWLMLLARIGAGIAGATISTAQAVIADVTPPEKRTRGMALIGMAFGIGFTFGPILGIIALVADPFTPRGAERVSLAQVELTESAGPPRTQATPAKNAEEASRGSPSGTAGKPSAANSDGVGESAAAGTGDDIYLSPMPGILASLWSLGALLLAYARLPETRDLRSEERAAGDPRSPWEICRDRPGVLPAILVAFTAVFAFSTFETSLSLLAELGFGYSRTRTYAMFCCCGLTLAFAQGFLVRRLAGRMPVRGMILLGIAIMLAGQVGLSASTILAIGVGLPASMFVIIVGYSMMTTGTQSAISLAASAEEQGSVLGVNQAASALSRILGPLVGQLLFGLGYHLPSSASAVLLAVAGFLAFSTPGQATRQTDQPTEN
jgi:MFS family permease